MDKFYIQGVNTKDMKIILQQMEKNICKIINEDGSRGTGFFCLIPINDFELLPVLITCNHVLDDKKVFSGKQITITINNDKEMHKILMDKSRKIYTNMKFNITIIEIKKNDDLNDASFLEIDNEILNSDIEELTMRYMKKPIYLLSYAGGKKSQYSTGVLLDFDFDCNEIRHNCPSDCGSSGGPLININNYKVIGVHEGANRNYKYNIGIFLQKPIEEFKKKFNNNDPETLLKRLKKTKEELNKEILKNQKLEEKIKELEKELAKEKGNKVNLKNPSNNSDIMKRLELMEKLDSKENEIKKIISRYPFELLEGESILSVIFISSDQKIHYSIICKNTEKFSDVESRLYKVYPEYLESDNYFLTKGGKVIRFKTIEENNIKNSDIITLEKFE